MDPIYPPQKKGLSGLTMLSLGCAGMIALLVVIGSLIGLFFGPKIQEMAPRFAKMLETAEKNPARSAAGIMVAAGHGNFEMSAEDDANQRYTVHDKKSGALFTFYWDANAHAVRNVKGDFSAIPAEASAAPQ